MNRTFFARRALLILCVVFFLTPFALRGARMAMQRMTNNVKDWLPSDFPETADLEWFGKHFLGEQFIIVTWPGCTEDDERYLKFVDKLQHEVDPLAAVGGRSTTPSAADIVALPPPKDFNDLEPQERAELDRHRARVIGDGFGLSAVGDTHQDWGSLNEKWLRGDKETWFYITPDGELYRWNGQSNFVGYMKRTVRRSVFNDRTVDGTLIATLGRPSAPGRPNEFHEDPRKLTARLFKSITTGPDTLEVLAEKGGPLWPRGLEDEYAAKEAKKTALDRLRGTLFGPDDKQTCIILTLSEPGKRDLRRVIGRPLLGRTPGRLLEIAAECNISDEDLKLGGPPVDNVAIDEEGQITLARLIGYSALIGIVLSLVCFRSIKITIMIFFVGGVSAISSLGIVWWSGGSVDAILMSMPSLVYVLGLSGAVHIVNYYREAVQENGLEGAPEAAVSHGWRPCTLAAFTTALGLLSLNTSNIVPIRKFGFYSALGVMATLILMFTYLPSALQLWPPGYEKRRKGAAPRQSRFDIQELLLKFWEPIGRFVVRRYILVTVTCTVVMVVLACGLPRIKTDVQLIKLFDKDSKIIRDYAWLEDSLGKLVPMELVVRVRPEMMRSTIAPQGYGETQTDSPVDERVQLDFLERMEIAAHIQNAVETEFGDAGQGIVGHGMSIPTFAPELPDPNALSVTDPIRGVMNRQLERHRDEYLATDYLRIDTAGDDSGSELWRVSLRLGALLNVDYGQFVDELKRVVEPVMTAYRHRQEILTEVDRQRGDKGLVNAKVAFLGISDPSTMGQEVADPEAETNLAADQPTTPGDGQHPIDQTRIFAQTLKDLMACAGIYTGRGCWHQPDEIDVDKDFYTSDAWAKILATKFECVVLVRDHESYDIEFIKQHAKAFIDARDHPFDPHGSTALTSVERKDLINVVYTGVVPIVYKAQRTLLISLIDSIGAAFLMIALVMMILLRRGRLRFWSLLNFRGGITSMIPNVFPVVLIFGAMGYLAISVDIGTMMTASVAMGVAVDDTIHFLTWFRAAIAEGRSRKEAILDAYRRCAPAMSQTTLIGGLGLAVFAFSTFTPTQCFGVMMLALLAAALVGDLVFLPALLAGPLGKYFCPEVSRADTDAPGSGKPRAITDGDSEPTETAFGVPHMTGKKGSSSGEMSIRRDRRHKL